MKIAIIGTNGLPGRYGGWDQLLNHLTLNLKDEFSFVVYTSSYNAVKGLKEYNGAKIRIIPLKANGIQSIFYDAISMFHAIFYYDKLLILGTSGCIFLPLIKLFKTKKQTIILNPDGQEWKRGKWNKFAKWFLALSEKFGVKYSNVVISDNKKIQDYLIQKYKRDSILIEYGGDNAKYVPISEETCQKYGIKPNQYAFKVCRIEPENNIDMILEAFKETEMTFILVGNWNFSKYGQYTRKKYSMYKNLRLLDPIYEQTVLDELRGNCGIYIHGHSVGGTNPSLVEAMNLGLCCIAYNVEYNIETTENKAIYFSNSLEIKKIINNFQNNEINFASYKTMMKDIATKRYKWKIITDKYLSIFNEQL
jgi:glycosyltransferase involved in cell wall biosynthesis